MRKKKSEIIEEQNNIENEEIIDEEENTAENEKNEQLDENVIKKISPAKWEGLLGILEFLTKDSDDSVIIKDSVILYGYKGGSIIRVDLSEVFDGEPINLHISSPKKWTRLFKTLKDNPVYIIDEENKFIVTNNQIKLFLPKQISSITSSLEFPSSSEWKKVSDTILQKEDRNKIIQLGKDLNYIEFLIKDNKLKCVNIPNTAVYILPEFVQEEDAQNLNTSNSDLTLRTQIFLPYPSETYQLMIGKNMISGSHFAYSICKTNLIKIEIYEQLDNASGIDQLF